MGAAGDGDDRRNGHDAGAFAQLEKRFEDFRGAIHRELDLFKAAVWAELGSRREARWRTVGFLIAVCAAILSTGVAVALALFEGT